MARSKPNVSGISSHAQEIDPQIVADAVTAFLDAQAQAVAKIQEPSRSLCQRVTNAWQEFWRR